MKATLPKHDRPVHPPRLSVKEAFEDPAPSTDDLNAFIAAEIADAKRSMLWLKGQVSVSSDHAEPMRTSDPDDRTAQAEKTLNEIERGLRAYLATPPAEVPKDVLAWVKGVVKSGDQHKNAREKREMRVRIAGWLEQLTGIYTQHEAGGFEYAKYENTLKGFLAVSLGTQPTEDLLTLLDYEPHQIRKPLDAQACGGGAIAKGAGAAATAAYALQQVLDAIGASTPHSARTLEQYRSFSPGKAPQRKVVEFCGEGPPVPARPRFRRRVFTFPKPTPQETQEKIEGS